MSTDQELLELAAKAIGMTVLREGEKAPRDGKYWFFNQVGSNPPALYDAGSPALTMWAPLTDDSDALRLAVELQFDLSLWGTDVFVRKDGLCLAQQSSRPDRSCSTRRAIVRAAAEIGKAMP
jgi:hypothetical protein